MMSCDTIGHLEAHSKVVEHCVANENLVLQQVLDLCLDGLERRSTEQVAWLDSAICRD